MKRFIVVREAYNWFGPSGRIQVTLEMADDLDALVLKLYPEVIEDLEPDKDPDPLSPSERLQEANGNGMDYYHISELVGDQLVTLLE